MPLYKPVTSLENLSLKAVQEHVIKLSMKNKILCNHKHWEASLDEVLGMEFSEDLNNTEQYCSYCKSITSALCKSRDICYSILDKVRGSTCSCKNGFLANLTMENTSALEFPTVLNEKLLYDQDRWYSKDYPRFLNYNLFVSPGMETLKLDVARLNKGPDSKRVMCTCLPEIILKMFMTRCQNLVKLEILHLDAVLFLQLRPTLYECFSKFSNVTDLTLGMLSIPKCVRIKPLNQDQLCFEIAKYFKKLENLQLYDFEGTARGIKSIAIGCKELRRVTLREIKNINIKISKNQVVPLFLCFENLKIFNFFDVPLLAVLIYENFELVKASKPSGLGLENLNLNDRIIKVLSLCSNVKELDLGIQKAETFKKIMEYELKDLQILSVASNLHGGIPFEAMTPFLLKIGARLTRLEINGNICHLDISFLLVHCKFLTELKSVIYYCKKMKPSEVCELPCNHLEFSKPFRLEDLHIELVSNKETLKIQEESIFKLLSNMPELKSLYLPIKFSDDDVRRLVEANCFANLTSLYLDMSPSSTFYVLDSLSSLESIYSKNWDTDKYIQNNKYATTVIHIM